MAFTDKGLKIINFIVTNYKANQDFTAKDLDVAPASLTALVKDGYLSKQATKPVRYFYTEANMEKIQSDLPKAFAPYSKQEFFEETKLNYEELVEYCINKYGNVTGDYFCTPTCKSPNPKIKRGDEGLYIHHIKEDTFIQLSTPEYAQMQPWEYQEAKNLVYCNIFEHLLLHLRITEIQTEEKAIELGCYCGFGGAIHWIIPAIWQGFQSSDQIENITYSTFSNYIQNWLNFQYKNDELFHSSIDREKRGGHIHPFITKICSNSKAQLSAKPEEKSKVTKTIAKLKRIVQKDNLIEDKRSVRCIETGIIYDNLSSAAQEMGGKCTIHKIMRAITKKGTASGYHWEYVEKEE